MKSILFIWYLRRGNRKQFTRAEESHLERNLRWQEDHTSAWQHISLFSIASPRESWAIGRSSENFRVDEEVATCENEIANPTPTLPLWPYLCHEAMKSNTRMQPAQHVQNVAFAAVAYIAPQDVVSIVINLHSSC